MKYSEEVLEKARKAVEIGQAILEGKEIEFLPLNGEWVKVHIPTLDISTYDYRVKPEPKYVPFTYEDANELIGKAVKHKSLNYVELIKFISDTHVGDISFVELFQYYTFLDGTPCGKLVNR